MNTVPKYRTMKWKVGVKIHALELSALDGCARLARSRLHIGYENDWTLEPNGFDNEVVG
jgi:hypothetical protein